MMFSQKDLVVMDMEDDVGIIKRAVGKGQKAGLVLEDFELITLQEDTPFGFEVAIKDIEEGEEIINFGQAIGIASVVITGGEIWEEGTNREQAILWLSAARWYGGYKKSCIDTSGATADESDREDDP